MLGIYSTYLLVKSVQRYDISTKYTLFFVSHTLYFVTSNKKVLILIKKPPTFTSRWRIILLINNHAVTLSSHKHLNLEFMMYFCVDYDAKVGNYLLIAY